MVKFERLIFFVCFKKLKYLSVCDGNFNFGIFSTTSFGWKFLYNILLILT